MEQTLILAGVSGDLASRKLLPALRSLADDNALPFSRVIGTARREVTIDPGSMGEHFSVRQIDISNAADIATLSKEVAGEVVVYLSLPPGTAAAAARALAEGGLGHARLVLEKPFGFDAESAKREAVELDQYFQQEQLYRVDHFLFKSLAAETSGKAAHAERLTITASEDSTVGHRANFYEATGALRDFGNHLLSLAAVALGGRHILPELQLVRATRAQYTGYRNEVGNPSSDTETFFALELVRGDTTVLLASGKGFATKDTTVRVDDA
ncbi:MAG TPA: hypothetical protein VIY48_13215, partial [Candidatus Paceibacterota bacterium]